MSGERSVVHAYGTLGTMGSEPTWPAGIAETPVATVTEGEAVVLTSRLPSEEFDPTVWESRANDPVWLGAVAIGHHRVLQAAIAVGDVVPFRLPSLYGDLDVVRQAMRDHADDIAAAMDRVRGRVEWAVKLFRAEEPGETAVAAATGADYLRTRSREAHARAEAEERLQGRVHEAYDRIRGVSVAAVRNPPQDPVLSGRREPMLLNAAFLVSRAEQDRLCAAIDRVAGSADAAGLLLEASGPWPAYNFASVGGPGTESP